MFRCVYDAYYRLARFILAKFGTPDDRIDDLLQEVFVRLFNHRANIASPGGIKPWLAAAARNLAIDLGRKLAREKERAAKDSESNDSESALDEHRPEQGITVDADAAVESELREFNAEIANRFAALLASDPEGQVLVDFYVRGKTAREIAAANNEAVSTVTTRLTRLRRRFNERLSQWYREQEDQRDAISVRGSRP